LGKRVTRRTKTRKRREVSKGRRREGQRLVQREIDEGVVRIVREVIEKALQDEVTEVLGRVKGERRDVDDPSVVEASCNRCGSHHRRSFYRAGFYRRGLLTYEFWGQVKVPRLSCVCGGMVDFEFVHLVPYGRLWGDMAERARELAGLCVSLRDSIEVLAWRNGQPLSLGTVNRLVNEAAELAEGFRSEIFRQVPAVVMLDGVWLKVLEPTGEEYLDKQGRRRQRLKGRRFALLVAYGIDPVTGQRRLLDWERGRDEDEESWRKLLERLLARGLCGENGLELFVHDGSAGLEKAFEMVHFGSGVERQRCIFHKLQNVRRDVVGEEGMNRKEKQRRRTEVLEDAAAVYRGKDEGEIKHRLARFREKWQEKEPKAVQTLEREFERTLVYLKVRERARQRGEEWLVEYLRATSALERVQRHFRQKFRQVVIFHAEKGLIAAVQLVISHRQLANKTNQPWTRLLEETLLAA
jgi:transposase-like protein